MKSDSTGLSFKWLYKPYVVIAISCLIAMIGFGIRSSSGFFLQPVSDARGWNREIFSVAMAIQNLFWGLTLPFASVLADKFGVRPVLFFGAIVYAAGFSGMAISETGSMLYLTGGVLSGVGVAFTSFSIILASIARLVGPEKRSLALGLGTAAGSMGQVVFSPLSRIMIHNLGWFDALVGLGGIALIIFPLTLLLPSSPKYATTTEENKQSLSLAVRQALGNRNYVLLTIGFYVCGYHVAFITVHFPAYIRDIGLSPELGALAISLVGVFNIGGSFLSGWIGQKWSKNLGLSLIYFLRSLAILVLIFSPKSDALIIWFSITMGILWLSTVPLTSGIVASLFGTRYMATLFGIVFLSHQIGSFMGVWLGGYFYDRFGNYDLLWWSGVGFGILAAILHLPIRDKPVFSGD